MQKPTLRKILLVRNDNIGDLICSIPAIQLLKKHLPEAQVHLLVNSYNAPVVESLVPKWVNRLIIYRKTKHVGLGIRQLGYLFRFYSQLSRERYDAAILLMGGYSRQAESFARWGGSKSIIGYGLDNGLDFEEGRHEVEYSWQLVRHLLGENKEMPIPKEIDYPVRANGQKIAIQITSRKPGNRWEAARFSELAKKIFSHHQEKSLLLWSPGNQNTTTHPGDDEKAADILERSLTVLEPRPVATLPDLISVLKECRLLITPDGGAMHLAAAMGIRIIAMFGQSDPSRWRPWTPHAKILQSPTHSIQDISVEDVFRASTTFL